MESSRTIVSSLVFFLLAMAAFAATAEARLVPDLIHHDAFQQTCNQVHFKKMCQSLTRLPKVRTPRELLLASMRVAAEKAKEAKSRVDEYAARNHEAGRPMESILSTCSKGYGDVADTLEEAEKMVAAGGSGGAAQADDMNTKLSSAVTSAEECDNGFQDFPEMKSPFSAMERNVWRLTDNVLGIYVAVKQSEDARAHVH